MQKQPVDPWSTLLQRRSIEQLEALLAERLELLAAGCLPVPHCLQG